MVSSKTGGPLLLENNLFVGAMMKGETMYIRKMIVGHVCDELIVGHM